MNAKRLIKNILFLSIFALVLTSCEDEPGTGTNAPSISFGAGSGGNITLMPGEVFTVRVTASKGDADLNALTVYEENTAVSFDRLTFNGTAASANPRLLFDADRTSLTYDIDIVAHNAVAARTYSIEVKDANGNARSVSLTVTADGNPPSLVYSGSDSVDANPSSLVSFNIAGEKGTGKLASISVYENDVLIDATRASFKNNDFDANPYNLLAADQDGFTNAMLIIRTSDEIGSKLYRVQLTDEFGLTDAVEFTINVGNLVETLTGVLLNQAGPMNTGGLDLDDGLGTGSMSTNAEIKDEGIDLGLPNATNWKQQISGANGAVVKYIIKGQNGVNENFTFGSVTYKEQIESLFDAGVAFTQTNANMTPISNKVAVGDVFVVSRDNKFYLIEITAVTVTPNDNADSYTMNIKK